MLYRKLDADGDLVFGHGLKDYYQDNVEAIAQSVKTRLQLWRGEWYLNTQEGTPYMQEVLGKNTKDLAIRALQTRILDTEGVTSIKDFQIVPNGRHMSFYIVINTIYGEVSINA